MARRPSVIDVTTLRKAVPIMNTNPHKLAEIGDVGTLREIFDEDDSIDVNTVDKYGCTPLIWGARGGKVEVVAYLIKKGADLTAKGYGGMNAMHHACNQLEEDVLGLLISSGADVGSVDDSGNTPLHWSCERGVLRPVQALIEAGADLNVANKAGVTPLHKACNSGHLTCAPG